MWPFRLEPTTVLTRPEYKINYPDGVAVETEKDIYYIKGGKRYRFVSGRAVNSWHLVPLVGSERSVAHIPYGGVVGFRDGTLLRDISNAKLYLISNSRKRHITGPDVFIDLGLSQDHAIDVAHEEVAVHQDGADLG